MKILFFQSGEYREAYLRLKNGGAETYRDQRASVDYAESLSQNHIVTTVAISGESHDVQLTPTLRSIATNYDAVAGNWLTQLLDDVQPDRIVCRMPHAKFLAELKRRAIPTLPCFADIFVNDGLRAIYRNLRLRGALSGAHIPCVANHSLNATRSVSKALFIPSTRTVPWDWSRVPVANTPKASVTDPAAPSIFFAGIMSEDKGVGDVLRAIQRAHRDGFAVRGSFAGPGDLAHWERERDTLGLTDAVSFLGQIPYTRVRAEMRAHDFVTVPSRHSYAEGLPNTIYEALAARSALIISDHPAFSGRLTPNKHCLIFKAGNAGSLADCIARLCREPGLYANLSKNAVAASEGLYIGLLWEELINLFLDDPCNISDWVGRNSMQAFNET